jgi:hypothetical protein
MAGSDIVLKVGGKVRVTQKASRGGETCPPDAYMREVGTIASIEGQVVWVNFEEKPCLSFYPRQLTPVSPQ